MSNYTLEKSKKANKKFVLKNDSKEIHFGAKGYSDFTKHKNQERKENYIKRHSKNENWNKINAGSASRFILWNKPTIQQSVKDFEKRFHIKIKSKV